MKIAVYTDGSCRFNPGPGGWGYVIVNNGRVVAEKSMPLFRSTNNRAEILAVINALAKLSRNSKLAKQSDLIIYTDSLYVANPINKGWLTEWVKTDFAGKKNKNYWLLLRSLMTKFKSCTFRWVKGHKQCKYNNRADELAYEASNKAIARMKQAIKDKLCSCD